MVVKGYICMNEKFTLEVPQELSAIPLKQYQKYLKVMEDNKDAEDTEFINLKVLEIFCGVTMKQAYKLPLAKFSFIINHVINIFKEETPLQRDFTMKDPNGDTVKFGFIPKLDDISLGEFVDLDNYIGDWNKIHKAMAVLYRPITFQKGDLYLIEEYESSDKYSEIMKDAPVNVALGATVFFYRLGKALSTCLVASLESQAQKSSQFQEALEKNGVGINQFMQSLEVTLQGLKKLPNSQLPNA
tara:strand:- start:979 stop:1707 length:729 start_codon:yes stop_codon:yes gene_type:complete